MPLAIQTAKPIANPQARLVKVAPTVAKAALPSARRRSVRVSLAITGLHSLRCDCSSLRRCWRRVAELALGEPKWLAGRRLGLDEAVANAAHRLHDLVQPEGCQRLAQAQYVDVDGAFL